MLTFFFFSTRWQAAQDGDAAKLGKIAAEEPGVWNT